MNMPALDTKKIDRPANVILPRFLHTLVGALILTWAANAAAVSYSVTDLGTLGGMFSGATGINASGQVVGHASTAGNASWHAFLYSPGSGMVDIGTLGGTDSFATGINASGQVVGSSYTASGDYHAFLYTPGSGMVDLGTLGSTRSEAYGINDSGQVVGWSYTAKGAKHAFLYSPGSGMVDLGTLGGTYSEATGINASGQVVGSSGIAGDVSAQHAFLYSPGSGMVDIGTLGGTASIARSINASGQVVGLYYTTAYYHAFLYTPGRGMVDLGTLGGAHSEAHGINASGQVVGYASTTAGSPRIHAFLYSPGSGMVDIGTLGGTDSGAKGINASGQVVGHASTVSNWWHAFLYTPEMNTITLSLNNLKSKVEPSGTAAGDINSFSGATVQVVNAQTGQPYAGAKVRIKVGVTAKTGGHDHDDALRPKGTLSSLSNCGQDGVPDTIVCTTQANGYADFTFFAPEASGTHTITATCESPTCIAPASSDINVQVDGLAPMPSSNSYVFVGAVPGFHTDNHNLVPTAKDVALELARQYHAKFPTAPLLHYNDASLYLGGVLDICTGQETTPGCSLQCQLQPNGISYTCSWSAPHKEHRRGSVVDVRANNDVQTAIPAANFQDFKKIARSLGADPGNAPHSPNSPTNRHWHVRLLGVKE